MRRETEPEPVDVEALIKGIERDGVPLSRSAVLHRVEDPCWESTRTAHDWRAYVPPAVRRSWTSLPLATRLCVFETAELLALEEGPGATMVTGPARG